MRGLRDRVAIVAGAAPGNIGGATAVRLAEEGRAVVVADLDKSAAQSVVDEIRAHEPVGPADSRQELSARLIVGEPRLERDLDAATAALHNDLRGMQSSNWVRSPTRRGREGRAGRRSRCRCGWCG